MKLHPIKTLMTLMAAAMLLTACTSSLPPLGFGDDPLLITVEGKNAYLSGTITQETSSQIVELMAAHPDINTLVLTKIDGASSYRDIRDAARLLREYRLNIHVPANGVVSPVGVDFFIGGANRTVEDGAKLLVSSWNDGELSGADLPRHNSLHNAYLRWYRECGIPDSFYWFSLKAAPTGQQHELTREEMEQFNIISPQ